MLKGAIIFQLLSTPKNKKDFVKVEPESHLVVTNTISNISNYISGLFSNSSEKDDQKKLQDQTKQDTSFAHGKLLG